MIELDTSEIQESPVNRHNPVENTLEIIEKRGGETETHLAHNQEIEGSNPSPATIVFKRKMME